ncbi:MAG: LPS export ABC transporter permease LptF [Burkholderiaceae bacterium]|jgi:lipopolysaccharide export system permease protein|nr:LPS export ABC transporter permease LptF [Burkholderiaceae bacterium]
MPESEKPQIIKKMLFQKSLLRELRSTSGGVLAVLLTTLVTMILIRALGRAASGRVDGELVLPLIVFNTLNLMSTVLMLTVYISVFMVLSRWWRDSEMVIWLSSGKSLADFLRPVWRFMWPMILLVALTSTVVAPWSKQQISEFEDEIQNRGDAQRVSPGQFRESYSGQRVFFLENPDDEGGRTGSVFIRSIDSKGQQSVLVSSTGRFETDTDGQQWIVLERGYRTDLSPDGLETQTTGFDVYRFRVDQSTRGARAQETIRSASTLSLVDRQEPAVQGELALRVGLPLLTLALGVLAIPLAVTQARSGRAVNLILALLIYLTASNLFTAVTATVTQGKWSLAMAWWPLPTLLLAIAAGMIWWRMR